MGINRVFSGEKEWVKSPFPHLKFDNGQTKIELPEFIQFLIYQAIDSNFCDGTDESIYMQIQYHFNRPLGYNEMVLAAIACSTDEDNIKDSEWVKQKLQTQGAVRAQIYEARLANSDSGQIKYDPLGINIVLANRDLDSIDDSGTSEDATEEVENYLKD